MITACIISKALNLSTKFSTNFKRAKMNELVFELNKISLTQIGKKCYGTMGLLQSAF
jgi:hypothetical protein